MSNNAGNVVTINTARSILSAVVGHAFSAGTQPANVMLHGSPGLGKSAIVKQLVGDVESATGKEVKLIDLRLSAMESSDVQGIPYTAKTGRVVEVENFNEDGSATLDKIEEQEMFFSTPAWWPNDPNKLYVLFLDELTNCPIHVQHAAYRLILDREIQNGKRLPANVAIIAAGNLKKDKTGARDLAPAAANRFAVHLEIDNENAAHSFIQYAVNNNFHPAIVGFLNWKGQQVYSTPEQRSEAAYATPRSWEFADGHLKNEALAKDDHMLRTVLAGCLGSSTAIDFAGFLDFHDKVPNWEKVKSGQDKYEVPAEQGGLPFAVSTSLAFELMACLKEHEPKNGKDMTKEVDNLTDVMVQLPRELKTIAFKTMKMSNDMSIMMKFTHFKSLNQQWGQVSANLK